MSTLALTDTATEDPVAADAPLLRTYRTVIDALDTDRRAWIVGLARLVDAPDVTPAPTWCRLLRDAIAVGDFPTSPVPFEIEDVLVACAGRMDVHASATLPGGRRLDYRIIGGPRSVAVALTRNGQLDDSSHRPGHVQLADAESVLLDTVTLIQRLAHAVGHATGCHLVLGIACDIPGHPLELRVFDEDGGDLLRPPAGYDEFDLVYADFHTDLTGTELDVWCWDACLPIVEQFGVFEPQMIRHPHGRSRSGWRVGPL